MTELVMESNENENNNNSNKRIKLELPSDSSSYVNIVYSIYTNDGTNESNIALIALKNIFSRQLPKMPKEYIVRLVFDKRHYTLAIEKQLENKNKVIIGGICYRPYFPQRFGEIAFCAINGTEQVRGYGTMLMNQLKNYVIGQKLEYFLTYADNFAIGYFQKQGFSKSVSMNKDRWQGFIKDYDGGTLMECYIHPNYNYLSTRQIISYQRKYIVDRINERSRFHLVHDASDLFSSGKRLSTALDAPGVNEAGWTNIHILKGNTERDRNIALRKLTQQLDNQLDRIKSNNHVWVFDKEIDAQIYPDYYDKILNPIDLSIITSRLKSGNYYRTSEMLLADLMRMISNCKSYFPSTSQQYQSAEIIEKLVSDIFKDNTTSSLIIS